LRKVGFSILRFTYYYQKTKKLESGMISTLEELEFQVLHFGVMGMVSTLEETLFEFKFCNLRTIDLYYSAQLSNFPQLISKARNCMLLALFLAHGEKTLKDFLSP